MSAMYSLSAFKAYDIRGRVPDELNPDLAHALGLALTAELSPRTAVVGRDARLSGESLLAALCEGLRQGGADVTDIGLCGTEEIYHAAFSQGFDAGVIVTASHNPADYNGMKLVRKGAAPISGDSGLLAIKDRIAAGRLPAAERRGDYRHGDFKEEYVRHLLGYVDAAALKPLRIVADCGHGCAGPVLKRLEARLPFTFLYLREEPDGAFPTGVPNPLLPENRAVTSEAVREVGADFGLAWDGDFDRCFFYDGQGNFIEGYYLVGLLAQTLQRRHPGAKIIHDPRLTWNTIELVREAGGIPVESKTGHAFIKERMRAENALYGGEMSAHHYFREFAYCDSGMIPWLLIAELLSATGKSLASLVEERMRRYPCSGEINRKVADAKAVMAAVRVAFAAEATHESHVDGLSLEFADWRMNLRSSNTEPLLRLNVETRGDARLMEAKTQEVLAIIEHFKDKMP